MKRKYRHGARWAFWRWSETPSGFLTRLHLVKTPWFAVALHWIHAPDPEPWLHDHPVTFLSLILRGGYTEMRENARGLRFVWRRWWNYLRATGTDTHKIVSVRPRTLTLCFMGPVRRRWGYHLGDGSWQYYKEYQREQERIAVPVHRR